MNRWLQFFNLVGVLALATLCGVQWQRNRAVNLDVHALEKMRHEQAAALEERERTTHGCAADLETFRQQVTTAKAALREAEERSSASARVVAQVAVERDALKTRVPEWASAVRERDEQLQMLSAQVRAMAAERTEVVTKFNELGEKYNQLVTTLNDRTRQFNELAEKYQQATRARAP